MTPHNHKVLFGIKQRRQEEEVSEHQGSNRRGTKKPVPEELKLPFEVYKDVNKDNVHYKRFRDLVTSGKTSEAKKVKEKIIEVWEKKKIMKIRRKETTANKIDVQAMFSDM